jgi:hypothetical protein
MEKRVANTEGTEADLDEALARAVRQLIADAIEADEADEASAA